MGLEIKLDRDAFSNGQIDSKIWLCEELEKLFDSIDNIYIYGGWYGLTAFMLRIRNNLKIKSIRSYDIDPGCELVADSINENWVFKEWQFKSFTGDCNEVDPIEADLIINTSTEHFESDEWYNRIPRGKVIAVQGNNMPHDDHHIASNSVEEFSKQFDISQILFQGEKQFVYPSWQFTRYMIIGIK